MATLESPIRWIRRQVFGVTQDELATIGGVSRPRVSRYETLADAPPYEFLQRVRQEAMRRGVAFSGDWFFAVPGAEPSGEADEGTGQ